MKQVEQEYFKPDDKMSQTPAITSHSEDSDASKTAPVAAYQTSTIHPPSPDQTILHMSTGQIPIPIKDAVSALIKSSTTIQQD